jgi:hypothetical protein
MRCRRDAPPLPPLTKEQEAAAMADIRDALLRRLAQIEAERA